MTTEEEHILADYKNEIHSGRGCFTLFVFGIVVYVLLIISHFS